MSLCTQTSPQGIYHILCSDGEGGTDSCTPSQSPIESSAPSPSDNSSPMHEPQAPRKTAHTSNSVPSFQLSPPPIHRLSISPPATTFEHPLERRRREKQEQISGGLGGWSTKMSSLPAPPISLKAPASLQISPQGFAFCNLVASRSRAPSSLDRPTAKKKLVLDPEDDDKKDTTWIPHSHHERPSAPAHSQEGKEDNRRVNVMSAAARVRLAMAKRLAAHS